MKFYMIPALVLGLVAGTAQASTTVDFNSYSGSDPSVTLSGVTFTPIGGGTLDASTTPNGTTGLLAYAPGHSSFAHIRADISGLASFVSIDLGDYNSDADSLFLEIYNSSNVLLGSSTDFIPSSFTGMKTLSASASNIAYAIFYGVGFNGESNLYADNFTFEAASGAVPEPTTWAMMLAGFGAVGFAMRRRRKVAVSFA